MKLLAGNPGKRPIAPEPDFARGRLEMPAFLESDPEAVAEWQRVAPQLARAGVTRAVDSTLLAAYCSAVGRGIRASQAAENLTAHIGHANRCWDLARKLGAVFGLGPAERGRVPGTPAPKATTLSKFLA